MDFLSSSVPPFDHVILDLMAQSSRLHFTPRIVALIKLLRPDLRSERHTATINQRSVFHPLSLTKSNNIIDFLCEKHSEIYSRETLHITNYKRCFSGIPTNSKRINFFCGCAFPAGLFHCGAHLVAKHYFHTRCDHSLSCETVISFVCVAIDNRRVLFSALNQCTPINFGGEF